MLNIFPRAQAYPLNLALRKFGSPDLVKWLDKNAGSDNPEAEAVWWDRQKELEGSILADIVSGALVATAFQLPISITSTRERISADIWRALTLNSKACTASFRGLSLVEIEVFEDHWASRVWGIQASQELSEDGDSRVDEQSASDMVVSLSEDDETLTIGDSHWLLTGDIQQEIVRQLVVAYPSERWLKSRRVLDGAGSNSDTIAKAFTGSPNWPTLSRHILRKSGMCKLVAHPVDNQPVEDLDGSQAPTGNAKQL